METGKDLLTQQSFYKKRTNQKFATPQNRIRYNNRKARRKRAAKAYIDRKLDRNRTILERILSGKKEVTVSRDYLLGSGFDFNFISYHTKVDNVIYDGIYEFGITKLVGTVNYKIKYLQNG